MRTSGMADVLRQIEKNYEFVHGSISPDVRRHNDKRLAEVEYGVSVQPPDEALVA